MALDRLKDFDQTDNVRRLELSFSVSRLEILNPGHWPKSGEASPTQSSSQRRDVERLEAIVIDPAQVRVEEVAQIRQAVFEHRQAVEADAPGEALIDLRVEAAIREHIGMDHAAAEDFEPILALAEADLPARTAALDVDFERRRGEGEKARAEAHADMRHFEERLAEFLEHPLQVG